MCKKEKKRNQKKIWQCRNAPKLESTSKTKVHRRCYDARVPGAKKE